MNFIKKFFQSKDLADTGTYPGFTPKILVDYKIKDFNQLIDLFPEAAYQNTRAKEVLEELRQARTELMDGEEVYPEKDRLGTHLIVMEDDKGPVVRIWENWDDSEGKRVEGSTTVWHDFRVDKEHASNIINMVESLRAGSSPESEV